MFFKKNYDSINVNKLKNNLGKVSLIDIREPFEYSEGHIPSSKNIPMNNLIYNPDKYLDKNKEYYIVCQSGGRSSSTCKFLSKKGFNVINVSGGIGSYSGKLER